MRKDEGLHGLLGMSTAGQSPCFKISGGVCNAKDITMPKLWQNGNNQRNRES